MFVLASLAATSLLALPLPTCLAQGDKGSPEQPQEPKAQAREAILDKGAQDGLRKKLQAYLDAEAKYSEATKPRDRARASKKRESAKEAFRKDWDAKNKKANDRLLASMADLLAIYDNCFTLKAPKKSSGIAHKYTAELSDTMSFEYAMFLPKKYKPAVPMQTLVVLPGSKTAEDLSKWTEGREYFASIWPKKTAALETTIFHIPQLKDGVDMDPMPDYSREGQGEREQGRIDVVFGTLARTMTSVNVDRPHLFLDCGRGNCAFGLRFLSVFPDRFAGIVLRQPTAIEDLRLGSLLGKAVLMIETEETAEVIATLKEQLEGVTPNSVTVVKATDAYPHPAAADAIHEWMGNQKRNMVPAKVVIEPNHDRFKRAYWVRIERMNPVHTSTGDQRPRIEVEADRANNKIVVTAQGVENFTLMLNDDLVDLDKEFTVVVNGKAVTEQRRRDRRGMQRRMLERSDWEYLFPVMYGSSVPKAK